MGGVETAIGLGSNNPSKAGLDLLMKKSAVTMPRTGKPEEVAKLALFLASDDSSFANGSCIIIDAGWSALSE